MLKDTNVKDLTKDKGIRKGWQEQRRTIQKKKVLMTWIATMLWLLT